MKKILPILLLCIGCNTCPEKAPPFTIKEFNGRDERIAYGQTVRRPVYHAKVPDSWTQIDPDRKSSLLDTKKPIVSFLIADQLILHVHTFPSQKAEERIPPEAQVARWKNQCQTEDCRFKKIETGGFYGYFFEANHNGQKTCAWCLQLDFDHYQTLHFNAQTVEEEEHYKQMAADYTIKVTGPAPLVEEHQKEITLFADSFELIQEIPTRL